MKPIHACWIIGLYDKLINLKTMIQPGLKGSKITEALDPEKDFGEENPIPHLILCHIICYAINTDDIQKAREDETIFHCFSF